MAQSTKFGTFKGVFTPSILTILGVIMYLRLPMIVGEAGLFATIGIIVIAHLISATTGLSVSSIATDKKVKAGGTYYMISRSLGLPIGGTLGLALFIGLSFSVSLYLIGFSESFLSYWDFELSKNNIRLVGSSILIIVTIITFISTSLALKTQYFIMAAIILSLLSIILGSHEFTPEKPLFTNTSSTVPLMVLFGIFFPAVTGFEAGVSMSGDLKDPKKSIPLGAMSSVIVGFVVYIALSFFFSYTVEAGILAKDSNVLMKISMIPELVLAGIWGATLSSAFGSILGAPRILQATAVDKITPRVFAKGTGDSNEPRNALILTFLIAEAGILIGELDVIARIVSIFFITTYGFLNLSAAFERLTSADFRPSFKTPAWISFIGAAACFIVMIQLDFVAMIGASGILILLYLYLKKKELVLNTGDTWNSLWASLVKTGLKRLSKGSIETRNWRPNIIMFSGDETERPHLVEFGKDITNRLGILTGFELKTTKESLVRKKHVFKDGFFMHTHLCHDVYSGMDELIRTYGFNGVEPNCVLMGWNKNINHREQFINFIGQLNRNNFNALFICQDKEKIFGNYKTIDIWWSGWGNNLSFSITLLRHLSSSLSWSNSQIRLLAISSTASMVDKLHNSITNIIQNYRLPLEVKVINNSVEQLSVDEIIWRESQKTDLTFLGISGKQIDKIEKSYHFTNKLIEKLNTVVVLSASTDFEAYNLVDEIKAEEISTTETIEFQLPEIEYSNHKVINSEIGKIIPAYQEIVKKLSDKIIKTIETDNEVLFCKIEALIKKTILQLEQIDQIDVKHKKTKAWINNKNDFYFKLTKLLREYSEKNINNLQLQLKSGITWYQEVLENELRKYPSKLVVTFPKSEYIIKKNDSLGLKWMKLKKRIQNPFTKEQIPININYKKNLSFYLKDKNIKQLDSLLSELHHHCVAFIASTLELIKNFENQCNKAHKEVFDSKGTTKILKDISTLFLNESTELKQANSKKLHALSYKHQKNANHNLQLLCKNLAKINTNKIIARIKRKTKSYQKLALSNIAFPAIWKNDMILGLNGIILNIEVLEAKLRLQEKLDDFMMAYYQQIDINILFKTREFINKLSVEEVPDKVPELNLEIDFLKEKDFSEMLHKEFDHISDSISEKIPIAGYENKEINASPIEISLRKLIKHFVNIVLVGVIEIELKATNDEIKKTVYRIKDHLSYLHFEFENTDSEDFIEKNDLNPIIDEITENISLENKKLEKIRSDFFDTIRENTQKAFESLSSHQIIKSSNELSQSIIEQKASKGKGYFNQIIEDIEEGIKKTVLKILYSRSEGVLLARELSQTPNQRSVTERILDLLDEIRAEVKISNAIPGYYKNLFSGRSSISEDFWIERPIEQSMIEKAWRRYSKGHFGAVMILGERNSGKTAFCRYSTKKYFSHNAVYNIFPPSNGSTDLKEFAKTINHSTNLKGTVDKVFDKLPYNSVLVFNDLELWWESSVNGMDVINKLLILLRKYGSKCFFILNMNKFTYQKIKELIELEDYFISVITCQPFDSEELGSLILKRHRSGGLKVNYGSTSEEKMSEIKHAGIFNSYFNYSQGNPGMALNTWLNSIEKVVGEKLYMKNPVKPNINVFQNIPDDWKVIISQLLLHKRMDSKKLYRVMQIDQNEIDKHISAMQVAGLIEEKTKGLFIVNQLLDKFLSNYLHEAGYL